MNPYKALRHQPAKYIARRLESEAKRAIEENKELHALIAEYREQSPSTGASYSDYATLYRWVRHHRPLEVLECGTGITTVVIAQALKENEAQYGIRGRITSMEESRSYFDVASSIFPKALNSFVDIRLSEAVEDHYHIFRGVRYADVPNRQYDLVFVDGPDLHIDPKGEDPAFDMDVVRLIAGSDRPIAALVDTRTITCFVLSLLFPKTFAYDYLRKVGVLAPSTRADLATARSIVIDAMREHAFARPSPRAVITGVY